MKKIFLLAVLLFQLTFVFGQSVGSVVRSKTIYSGSGIDISYTVTYYGNGDCNNKPNAYYKKYKLDFSASNTSSSTVSLYGSRIDLDDNLNAFQDNCRTAAAILLGSYPGFEQFGILEPNERRTATMYAYMLSSANDLPYVSYSIVPKIQKKEQKQNVPNSNNNTTTVNPTAESKTYNSIQEAITKFNSLINQAATADKQKATQIQNNIQTALNSNGNTETFKLNIVNNGIRDLENLIARNNTNSNSNSTNQTTNTTASTPPQNDLTEYNRSKADLERQIAEKNADIQRQNLENQRQQQLLKQQQYNNSVNQANTSLGKGNYTEAINSYGEAGKNATTKSEKSLATTGVVTSGAFGILDGIQKQKDWNTERKRLKAEKVQSAINENEKRAEAGINTMIDPKIYETYCDFVVAYIEALGFHFMGISEILDFQNESKYLKLDFNKGELEAVVRQAYFNGKMQNHISFKTSNTMFHNLLLSSDLVAFLGSYNYFENQTFNDWKRNKGNKIEYELNFDNLFRLEKSQQFIEMYMNPYRTPNYNGIATIINEKEQQKIEFIPVKSQKAPENTNTVQSVIDKCINAIGGLEKLKSVQNMTTVTESEISKQKATYAYGKFVSNMMYKGNSFKMVFNGITGYRESDNKKDNLDIGTISMFKKTQPFPILQLQQEPNLELGEMVVFKGKECYTIIEKSESNNLNFVKKHYFDTISGLWRGTEQLVKGSNNYSSTSYTYYDDYREVEGILFPFIFQYFTDKNISTTKTIEIKLNESLTDKDFE